MYHLIAWPQLSYIALTSDGKIAGYVMGKLEEDDPNKVTGHFTSIAVKREYRRLGIAEKLLHQSLNAMASIYKVESISLHVRQSNVAAISLYSKKLGFEISEHEPQYYADGEDSYLMKRVFSYTQ
ncbi:N-alpha-acetyltransferase 11 [Mitosporidium daphniae]